MPKRARKRIVLTGVSRGLGRAMTEGFIDRGHVVLGCARSGEAIVELRRRHGPPHSFEVVDVSRDDEVAAWAATVLQGPAPDLLVNNAGLINRSAPLWQVPADEFSHVIDVNLKGMANVIRHFVPAMVDRGRGVIVNFSSGWGRSTAPQVAPYCASKWAVEGLTRALAEELPAGMAAVAVNPGIINTDMLRSCFGEESASYVDPATWARRAVPFILQIRPKQNGQPLSVPR
ncbi:MAG: oxidoreductase [Planctomycetes bacterium RBG_16_64_12]|nr:MAG: oxidoreductase [Planctomycetes bacterium RBG_16_64_12]